jgi:hypothetical protein
VEAEALPEGVREDPEMAVALGLQG